MFSSFHPLRTRWWIAAIRGTLSILLGIAAIYWPSITLATVVALCAAYAIADGIMMGFIGLVVRWWSMPAVGLVGIALGAFLLTRPAADEALILFAIAAWAMVRGAYDMAAAFRLRSELPDEWLLLIKGLLLLLFGVLVSMGFAALVTFFPANRALVLAWMIGLFALLEGALLLAFADSLRRADTAGSTATRLVH